MAEPIDRLKAHRAAAFQALVDLIGLASRQFKADAMQREWIDREQAMRLVPALRDSISGLAEMAREQIKRTDESGVPGTCEPESKGGA